MLIKKQLPKSKTLFQHHLKFQLQLSNTKIREILDFLRIYCQKIKILNLFEASDFEIPALFRHFQWIYSIYEGFLLTNHKGIFTIKLPRNGDFGPTKLILHKNQDT